MKRKVYLETSIVSYYTARMSRDLVIAARQQLTGEIWPLLETQYDRFISALVLQEPERGDPGAAAERVRALEHVPLLAISDEARELASALVNEGSLRVRCGRMRCTLQLLRPMVWTTS